MTLKKLCGWLSVGLILSCATYANATEAKKAKHDKTEREDFEVRPTGKGWGEVTGPPAKMINPYRNPGILYHGGPIMGTSKTDAVNVYYIWYGSWSTGQQSILADFMNGIGGSGYFNIETTYYNGSGYHVQNAVRLAGQATDNYSQTTSLTDASVETVVSRAISSGTLPVDSNGVYFVLTSPDVNESSGFCTQYCGWHTHATILGADIKFAFVGNPARCLSACAEQALSPNGDAGADAAVSIIAHELDESVDDPDLNAWYAQNGEESADKCAWTFGSTKSASNGSMYNIILSGKEFLIQQNWVNSGPGFCAMSH